MVYDELHQVYCGVYWHVRFLIRDYCHWQRMAHRVDFGIGYLRFRQILGWQLQPGRHIYDGFRQKTTDVGLDAIRYRAVIGCGYGAPSLQNETLLNVILFLLCYKKSIFNIYEPKMSARSCMY